MNSKINKIFNTAALLVAFAALSAALPAAAQSGSNAPFSQFGIGLEEQPFNMPMAARNGGAVISRSGNNFVNPFNPASYASIEPQSFVFDMGFTLQMSTLSNSAKRANDFQSHLGSITFAMPITKWWKIGGGLMPYSTADYESVSSTTDPISGNIKTRYDGYGSVSQVFIGSAFNIVGRPDKRDVRLQAGFNAKLLTGSIQRTIAYEHQGNDTSYFMNSRKMKDTYVRNFAFDAGLQFYIPLGSKYTLGTGFTFAPGMDYSLNEEGLVYTFFRTSTALNDTLYPLRGEEGTFVSRPQTASTFGLGLSLERDGMWAISLDYTFAPWSGTKYTEGSPIEIFGQSMVQYEPSSRLAMALEFKGDRDASSYWRRITWSAGGHYENNRLVLGEAANKQPLAEWGLGAGASLPMRKGRSLLSFSVAYSHFGQKDLLLQERLTFGIAISSCETWFMKRKYN